MTELPRQIQVTCYSGCSYADRPASFVWQGEKYEVKAIEKEWLEPGEKHFTVKTTSEFSCYKDASPFQRHIFNRNRLRKSEKGEKRFEICYHEREDSWSLFELGA